MIRVRDLNAGYGRVGVLKHVSIDVAAGEFVCLVGANGAGKSTLLRCVQGLLPVSAGPDQARCRRMAGEVRSSA